jgi:hypothetical protein
MSRSAKDLDMLIAGDAQRMGDPYGDELKTLEKLASKYGLTVSQVRDILDEASARSPDDY